MNTKRVLYIDMDNVLVDFSSGIKRMDKKDIRKYEEDLDDAPGIFALMDPLVGAIEGYKKLAEKFDTYVLSTAPWNNPSAWSDKVQWVKKYLGDVAYKRLTITHHKNLNTGNYLIDDREKNGAINFSAELILFGSNQFPNWASVTQYLLNK